jgi:hypothetical protein
MTRILFAYALVAVLSSPGLAAAQGISGQINAMMEELHATAMGGNPQRARVAALPACTVLGSQPRGTCRPQFLAAGDAAVRPSLLFRKNPTIPTPTLLRFDRAVSRNTTGMTCRYSDYGAFHGTRVNELVYPVTRSVEMDRPAPTGELCVVLVGSGPYGGVETGVVVDR